MADSAKSDREVLQAVLDLLDTLGDDERARVIRMVLTYFDFDQGVAPARVPASSVVGRAGTGQGPSRDPVFSGHAELSPKRFLLEKAPRTDIERAVCLAYYLEHYRGVSHFKTADINKLNTEAAQRKFANASVTVSNATRDGYLAPAPKQHKQLSSIGEQYVEALPNREAAKEAIVKIRPAKRARKMQATSKQKR